MSWKWGSVAWIIGCIRKHVCCVIGHPFSLSLFEWYNDHCLTLLIWKFCTYFITCINSTIDTLTSFLLPLTAYLCIVYFVPNYKLFLLAELLLLFSIVWSRNKLHSFIILRTSHLSCDNMWMWIIYHLRNTAEIKWDLTFNVRKIIM